MDFNKIYHEDCIELLKNNPSFQSHLIFADPPFNIQFTYDVYQDNKSYSDYVSWTEEWMSLCYNALEKNGSFYIAIGDDFAAEIKMISRKLNLYMRNWIIWHYSFGQATQKKFARSHTHILYFTKDKKNFTFNDQDIRIPSERLKKYNDKRGNPKGKIPDDVWEYPRVCGTFKERQKWHNCQMPISLLERIIKTSSNEGDVVFDPFCGSGTAAMAAAQLNRNYVTCDISENYVKKSRERIKTCLNIL